MLSEVDGPQSPPVIRLAILDDRTLLRSGLAMLLEHSGNSSLLTQVVYAGSDCGQARLANPDVVVVAIDTPGIPGERMAADLAREGRRVLLFGSPSDPTRIRATFDAGVLGLLPPASTVDDLHEAVTSVNAGDLHLNPAVVAILTGISRTPDLSPRELETLQLYASGLKLSAVAGRLGISPHTAKEYLDRVRDKYTQAGRQARTRTELFIEAQRDGFVEGRES
ncbi:MAG: LuxR C-terminal-related transcriptional regulator [Actinomycetales bacterium]